MFLVDVTFTYGPRPYGLDFSKRRYVRQESSMVSENTNRYIISIHHSVEHGWVSPVLLKFVGFGAEFHPGLLLNLAHKFEVSGLVSCLCWGQA